MGKINKIYLADLDKQARVETKKVLAVKNMGLEGDRYFGSCKNYKGWQLSLVEKEAIEKFCKQFNLPLDLSILKRNIVTEKIDLNHLTGREFQVGEALCKGIELCFPCMELCMELGKTEETAKRMYDFLLDCGGLRADIIQSGKIEAGSLVKECNTV